jgi:hypothetical protein
MPFTPSVPFPRMVIRFASTAGKDRSSSSDRSTSYTCMDSSVVPATIARALHVVQQVVVCEAAEILLERPASAIERLHRQHGAIRPLIALQWLLVAPDRDALAMIDQQESRQPGAAGPAGSE